MAATVWVCSATDGNEYEVSTPAGSASPFVAATKQAGSVDAAWVPAFRVTGPPGVESSLDVSQVVSWRLK